MGGRYAATEVQVLLELRERIDCMKACAKHERCRADEQIQRMVDLSHSFRYKLSPMEKEIAEMKGTVIGELGVVKRLQQKRIRQKLVLEAAQNELEEEQEVSAQDALTAQ